MSYRFEQGAQWLRLSGASGFAIVCSSWLVLAVGAQSLKIPDWRELAAPVAIQLKPGESCNVCGRILSIREVTVERKPVVPQGFQAVGPGPAGPSGPNLVGAVIYVPLGGESERRPFVGGVGTPEMRERFQENTYEISVRLDDGSLRFLQRNEASRYQVGDRIRITDTGQLELISD